MEELTGKQFGPYQIVAPLGEGGMAAVYKAYQPGMDRYVALKVLSYHLANNPEFAGRFEQEAKMLAKLQHPHILPVFDYGQSDGYTYIVMPFIQSGDLTDLLQGQALSLPQIRRMISQIGDALDYAHQRGLIHRDVKPSNVLLDERGNCLLTDFGIAKMVESSRHLTVTGGIIGTPAYMSPEQGAGEKLDSRSDIYALGIMLYEMATGRVPYRAETPMAIIIKHMHDPLPMPRQVNPSLPEAVERVILKSLAKQPADRYATAGEMVQALQVAIPETLTGQSDSSGMTVTLPEGPPAATRAEAAKVAAPSQSAGARWGWIAAAALVLLLVFFGLTFFMRRNNRPPSILTPPQPTELLVQVDPTESVKATLTPTALNPTQPAPTATLAEATSTPSPAELTHQVYDDFNNPDFEDSFNSDLWLPFYDEGCQVKQQDGALNFTAPVQTTDVSCEVVIARPETVSFEELGIMEARLQIRRDHTGPPINLGLALSRPRLPGDQWYTFCGLSAQEGQVEASFNVANYGPKEDFWQSLPAAYDKWYTFRLQADPATASLTCSVDGVVIGSISPKNAVILRRAKFSRSLGSYRRAGATATTLADDVVLEVGSSAPLPPEPDSALYDNFDDPAFDGSFNPTQWTFFSDTENGGQAIQSEGEIELERYDQTAGAIGLTAISYSQSLSTPTFFAADLMLTGPQNGHVYLAVGPEWMSKEYADCIFGHSAETGAIDCNYYYVNEDKLAYESPDFSVEYNTWHTVKIEVDPATMTFTFYMDDELLGDFTPASAKTIKNNDFTFNIGLWGEGNEALTGYVDNVRVGQP